MEGSKTLPAQQNDRQPISSRLQAKLFGNLRNELSMLEANDFKGLRDVIMRASSYLNENEWRIENIEDAGQMKLSDIEDDWILAVTIHMTPLNRNVTLDIINWITIMGLSKFQLKWDQYYIAQPQARKDFLFQWGKFVNDGRFLGKEQLMLGQDYIDTLIEIDNPKATTPNEQPLQNIPETIINPSPHIQVSGDEHAIQGERNRGSQSTLDGIDNQRHEEVDEENNNASSNFLFDGRNPQIDYQEDDNMQEGQDLEIDMPFQQQHVVNIMLDPELGSVIQQSGSDIGNQQASNLLQIALTNPQVILRNEENKDQIMEIDQQLSATLTRPTEQIVQNQQYQTFNVNENPQNNGQNNEQNTGAETPVNLGSQDNDHPMDGSDGNGGGINPPESLLQIKQEDFAYQAQKPEPQFVQREIPSEIDEEVEFLGYFDIDDYEFKYIKAILDRLLKTGIMSFCNNRSDVVFHDLHPELYKKGSFEGLNYITALRLKQYAISKKIKWGVGFDMNSKENYERVYKNKNVKGRSISLQIDEIIAFLNGVVCYRVYNSRDFVMILLSMIADQSISETKRQLHSWKFSMKHLSWLIFDTNFKPGKFDKLFEISLKQMSNKDSWHVKTVADLIKQYPQPANEKIRWQTFFARIEARSELKPVRMIAINCLEQMQCIIRKSSHGYGIHSYSDSVVVNGDILSFCLGEEKELAFAEFYKISYFQDEEIPFIFKFIRYLIQNVAEQQIPYLYIYSLPLSEDVIQVGDKIVKLFQNTLNKYLLRCILNDQDKEYEKYVLSPFDELNACTLVNNDLKSNYNYIQKKKVLSMQRFSVNIKHLRRQISNQSQEKEDLKNKLLVAQENIKTYRYSYEKIYGQYQDETVAQTQQIYKESLQKTLNAILKEETYLKVLMNKIDLISENTIAMTSVLMTMTHQSRNVDELNAGYLRLLGVDDNEIPNDKFFEQQTGEEDEKDNYRFISLSDRMFVDRNNIREEMVDQEPQFYTTQKYSIQKSSFSAPPVEPKKPNAVSKNYKKSSAPMQKKNKNKNKQKNDSATKKQNQKAKPKQKSQTDFQIDLEDLQNKMAIDYQDANKSLIPYEGNEDSDSSEDDVMELDEEVKVSGPPAKQQKKSQSINQTEKSDPLQFSSTLTEFSSSSNIQKQDKKVQKDKFQTVMNFIPASPQDLWGTQSPIGRPPFNDNQPQNNDGKGNNNL